MENKTYNHTLKFFIIFFVLFGYYIDIESHQQSIKSLQLQVDSLKMNQQKSDSIIYKLSDPFSESKYDSIIKARGYENMY